MFDIDAEFDDASDAWPEPEILSTEKQKAVDLIVKLRRIFSEEDRAYDAHQNGQAARLLSEFEGLNLRLERTSAVYDELCRLRGIWQKRNRIIRQE